MIFHINETDICWICGKSKEDITRHHVLPKHLKPVNNIIVPVCEGCHDKINADDITGMYAYLFKIKKEVKESITSINTTLKKMDDIKLMQQDKLALGKMSDKNSKEN